MPAAQKPPNAGKGRVKGVPNKTTATARSIFAAFVDGNAQKVQELWNKVAAKDAARAIELYAKLAEFHMPKLARTEVSGELAVRGKLVIEG